MLQSVTVTCTDITAVYLVENALNQSNVIMSTGPVGMGVTVVTKAKTAQKVTVLFFLGKYYLLQLRITKKTMFVTFL